MPFIGVIPGHHCSEAFLGIPGCHCWAPLLATMIVAQSDGLSQIQFRHRVISKSFVVGLWHRLRMFTGGGDCTPWADLLQSSPNYDPDVSRFENLEPHTSRSKRAVSIGLPSESAGSSILSSPPKAGERSETGSLKVAKKRLFWKASETIRLSLSLNFRWTFHFRLPAHCFSSFSSSPLLLFSSSPLLFFSFSPLRTLKRHSLEVDL